MKFWVIEQFHKQITLLKRKSYLDNFTNQSEKRSQRSLAFLGNKKNKLETIVKYSRKNMEHPLLPISKNENGLKPKKVRFISASTALNKWDIYVTILEETIRSRSTRIQIRRVS